MQRMHITIAIHCSQEIVYYCIIYSKAAKKTVGATMQPCQQHHHW